MFRHVDKVLLFDARVKLLLSSKKVALVGPGLLQWHVA